VRHRASDYNFNRIVSWWNVIKRCVKLNNKQQSSNYRRGWLSIQRREICYTEITTAIQKQASIQKYSSTTAYSSSNNSSPSTSPARPTCSRCQLSRTSISNRQPATKPTRQKVFFQQNIYQPPSNQQPATSNQANRTKSFFRSINHLQISNKLAANLKPLTSQQHQESARTYKLDGLVSF